MNRSIVSTDSFKDHSLTLTFTRCYHRVVEEDAEGGGKEDEEQEPWNVFYLAKRGLVDEVCVFSLTDN